MLTNAQIEELTIRYGMTSQIFVDRVFIRTDKAEWYYNRYESNNIRLYHSNYLKKNVSEKFSDSFHIQKKRFSSEKEIFTYIHKHDQKCYNKKVRKCRLEYLFEKIEAQNPAIICN